MADLTVLIIGGSGIISSEVCSLAIQNGYKVTILNRGRRKNKINPNARLIVADVKKESLDDIKNKLENSSFDIVVDFVSYDLPQLKKMLSAVSCRQYIFTSTATVYAEKNNTEPYKETDSKENDLWDYCIDKRKCEKYLEDLRNDNPAFNYTIVRPYVTYNETRFPFQVAPLEYYTIIYRVLHNLPIVICGRDICCTVTSSKDYAVALVGLFNNPAAYNEDFHITSDNITTWRHIIELTAEKLNCTLHLIDIPQSFLSGYKNTEISIPEILGDKGRRMVFNNDKIKAAVPEYKAESTFDSNIGAILDYFYESSNKKVNYLWCGCIDRLIYDYCKDDKKADPHLSQYKDISAKNKLMYCIGKYSGLYMIYKLLKTFKRLISRN